MTLTKNHFKILLSIIFLLAIICMGVYLINSTNKPKGIVQPTLKDLSSAQYLTPDDFKDMTVLYEILNDDKVTNIETFSALVPHKTLKVIKRTQPFYTTKEYISYTQPYSVDARVKSIGPSDVTFETSYEYNGNSQTIKYKVAVDNLITDVQIKENDMVTLSGDIIMEMPVFDHIIYYNIDFIKFVSDWYEYNIPVLVKETDKRLYDDDYAISLNTIEHKGENIAVLTKILESNAYFPSEYIYLYGQYGFPDVDGIGNINDLNRYSPFTFVDIKDNVALYFLKTFIYEGMSPTDRVNMSIIKCDVISD